MLESFSPENNAYSGVNSYRKKRKIESKLFKRRLLLPNFKKIEESGINTNYKDNNSFTFININYNENNNSEYNIKNIFNHSSKKINNIKKQIKLNKIKRDILYNNIPPIKKSKLNLHKASSLPHLKIIPNLEDSIINENNDFIYLEYKSKNNKNDFNKKTYIQVNPHKLIDKLQTVVVPSDIYGSTLFSSLSNYINKYDSNSYLNNFEINNFYSINNNSNNSSNDLKYYFDNELFLEGIYDKYSLPNKENKYNYKITKIFFTDIMNKIIKRMIQIRDKHNKTITQIEVKDEYKKELNKLKIFLGLKINFQNSEINKIINGKVNQDIAYLNYMKFKNDNSLNKKDKANRLFYIPKIDENKSKSLCCINNYKRLVLCPMTERQKLDNFKNEELGNIYKKIIMLKKKINTNYIYHNYNYLLEDGQKLKLVKFEDILQEIKFQNEECENSNKFNINKKVFIDLILYDKESFFKKLKFNNMIMKKFLALFRAHNINMIDINNEKNFNEKFHEKQGVNKQLNRTKRGINQSNYNYRINKEEYQEIIKHKNIDKNPENSHKKIVLYSYDNFYNKYKDKTLDNINKILKLNFPFPKINQRINFSSKATNININNNINDNIENKNKTNLKSYIKDNHSKNVTVFL